MGFAIPCSFVVATSAQAADIVKANNSNDLNLGSSWIGGTVPTASDVAVWNNTVTAANTVLLGAKYFLARDKDHQSDRVGNDQ